MPTVLITGGSGLIGKHLGKILKGKGFEVTTLTTAKEKADGSTVFFWNPYKNEIDKKAIEQAEYIIHLAGANIGESRWTKTRKQLIIDSRVKTTQLLFESSKNSGSNLKAFISASAVGYYGAITSDKIFSESDLSANDFLGEVCIQWEKAANAFTTLNVRTVILRTGLVLTKRSGALEKMMTPIKLGIASPLGNGKQYMPWIHIDDLCDLYLKAIEDNEMKGIYNAVAPEHITNKEFTKTLAKTLNKAFWFPNIPVFVLKLIFGEMSNLVLKGSRVSPQKITNTGFTFKFPDLDLALKDLFS